MHLPDPSFPPLLTGHGVKAPDRPLAAAEAGLAAGTLGAGDLVWARGIETAEWALILEPDQPLSHALQAVPLSFVAIADAIGTLAPPKVSITFGWPDRLRVNGGEIGVLRAIAPVGATLDAIPAFLILHGVVRISFPPRGGEPGEMPDVTALAEEGCPEITRTALLERFARHFLSWLAIWQDEGFRSLHDAYVFRAEGYRDQFQAPGGDGPMGTFLGLDEAAGVLLKTETGVITLPLIDHVGRSIVRLPA